MYRLLCIYCSRLKSRQLQSLLSGKVAIMANIFYLPVSAILGLLLFVAAGQETAAVLGEEKYGVVCVSDKDTSFDSQCQDSILNCSSFKSVEDITRSLSSVKILFLVTELRLGHSVNFQNLQSISFEGLSIGTIIDCSEAEESGAGLTFTHVHNLHIENVMFSQCSTPLDMKSYLNANTNTTLYRSTIHIVNSTNVSLIGINITGRPGSGLIFLDTDGSIVVKYSTFSCNENESGAVYIGFSRCAQEILANCNNMSSVINSIYHFVNCSFSKNNARLGERLTILPVNRMQELKGSLGKGGALCIYMNDRAFNNTVKITNSSFYDNSADCGGALYMTIRGNSSNNHIIVTGSEFKGNQSPTKGGGAVYITLYQ